jgi:hypothetical protein
VRSLRIATIAALALACGSSSTSTPPVKDPPQVFLLIPNTNVIGTELDVQMTVEGCDKVTTATITSEDGAINKTVSYTVPSGNAVPVSIVPADVAHWQSIAAHLSLVANATCDDGRKNSSQAQGVTFFPVAQVFSKANGSYVVPTAFYAEGSGASTTFTGCGSNSDGSSALVRVDTSGTFIATTTLPDAMDCNANSSITDPIVDAGGRTIRWLLTPATNGELHPGAVAFFFNSSTGTIDITAKVLDGSGAIPAVWYLGVDVNPSSAGRGDAVVLAPTNTGLDWIFRIDHLNLLTGHNTTPLWAQGKGVPPSGDPRLPMGSPVISGSNVWIPVREDGIKQSDFDVEQRSYSDGSWVSYPPPILITETFQDFAPSIAMSISADGQTTYLPFNTYDANGNWTGGFSVLGCASTGSCSSNELFNVSLTGSALATVPFGPGFSYVAAIGSQHTYFLGNQVGTYNQVLGHIDPTGALVTSQIQNGKGSDFYILNGPAGRLPLEIVGIDSPANGELVRYAIASDSVSMAIDDSGQPWFRISNKLVLPFPVAQYRAMLSQ